jgi:hypothetical protein
MRRLTLTLGTLSAILLVATTVRVRGRTFVGFDYRARTDTSLTACPDRVVGRSGTVITLASGERFEVCDLAPDVLATALRDANGMVKLDRRYGMIAVRKPVFACGLTPTSDQWFTIPLFARERLDTHYPADFGTITSIAADTATDPDAAETP